METKKKIETRLWGKFPVLALVYAPWPWPLVPALLVLLIGFSAILLLLLYYYIIRVND